MWRSVNSAIAGADVERKQEVPDAADAPLADEMIVDPASPPTALPAGDRAALARRLRPYGIMLGVMFVLFILSDYLFRPTFVSINVDSDETSRPTPALVSAAHLLLQLAVAVPAIRIAMLDRVDLRRLRGFAIVILLVLLTITLSLLVHPDAKAAVNLATVAWTFVVFGLLASTSYGSNEGVRDALAAMAVGLGGLLLWVAVEAEYSWGRLAGRVGPNYWGMVAFIAFVASFALPRIWQRVPLWSVIAFILLETSARGSTIALFIAAIVFALAWAWHSSSRQRGWFLAAALVLAVSAPVAVPVIASDVLLLTDARRGVSSGGTGRSIAWKQAFTVFADHPWLGVGFRQHRQYITIASSAHNAYLAALAEVGLIGFFPYLLLLLGGLWHALRTAARRREVQFVAVAAFLAGFTLIGLVESVWLTIGSPLPWLMTWFIALAWSRAAGVARFDLASPPEPPSAVPARWRSEAMAQEPTRG